MTACHLGSREQSPQKPKTQRDLDLNEEKIILLTKVSAYAYYVYIINISVLLIVKFSTLKQLLLPNAYELEILGVNPSLFVQTQ